MKTVQLNRLTVTERSNDEIYSKAWKGLNTMLYDSLINADLIVSFNKLCNALWFHVFILFKKCHVIDQKVDMISKLNFISQRSTQPFNHVHFHELRIVNVIPEECCRICTLC